ncbi:MAG: hypothetical protein JW913_01390 [Chitinispirillaceae bacterium]|nr:hypothetical protein [Chitinispirillaceae bacterium]
MDCCNASIVHCCSAHLRSLQCCHLAAISLLVLAAGYFPSSGASLVFPPYGHSYGIRKASPKHLFMFFGPRTFFDDPQGLATARLEAWEDTTTKKDDDEVVVYGVNSGRHQIIYNTSMWALGLYGKEGIGKDCFLHPKGVAANGRGDVYVADSGNNRVVKLFNPKSKLQWVRAFDAANGGFDLRGPSRVGLDEKGRVYVTDTGNRRVVVFDSTGKVLRVFPPCSGAPTALAVADGKAFYSFFKNEQAVFYAENGGKRVVKCSFNGQIIRKADLPAGNTASYGAIDYYHNYWITDTEKHCILKFDRHLKLLDRFGSYGTGDNQFDAPRGITIYKRYGQVFVAERKGAQYYWMGTDCTSASIGARRRPGSYDLTVKTTEYSFVSLFSLKGGDTCFYTRRYRVFPGGANLVVDGKGTDLLRQKMSLRVEPTYSSYTYFAWYFPVTARVGGETAVSSE